MNIEMNIKVNTINNRKHKPILLYNSSSIYIARKVHFCYFNEKTQNNYVYHAGKATLLNLKPVNGLHYYVFNIFALLTIEY